MHEDALTSHQHHRMDLALTMDMQHAVRSSMDLGRIRALHVLPLHPCTQLQHASCLLLWA